MKSFISFEEGVSHFHFSLGHANYVAGPQGDQESWLEKGQGSGSIRAEVTEQLLLGSWVPPHLLTIPATSSKLSDNLLHLSFGFCLIMAFDCW